MIGPLGHIPILPLPFLKRSVNPYEIVFTVGTTKFTLGMMDDGNLGLYYTDTEELIRSWDAI